MKEAAGIYEKANEISGGSAGLNPLKEARNALELYTTNWASHLMTPSAPPLSLTFPSPAMSETPTDNTSAPVVPHHLGATSNTPTEDLSKKMGSEPTAAASQATLTSIAESLGRLTAANVTTTPSVSSEDKVAEVASRAAAEAAATILKQQEEQKKKEAEEEKNKEH